MSVQTADVQETAAAADSSHGKEEGLRSLTGRDWLVSTAWGIFSGLAAGAASVVFLPVEDLALMVLLGAGLGVLGYLDHVTQLIRNRHNLIFGAITAVLLLATQTFMDEQILLPALVCAALTFGFFLVLTMLTGYAGGGDIKLSPIPAALLGAVSPIAAMLWLLFTFVFCVGGTIYFRVTDPNRRHTAMGPYMAAAAVLTIVVYGILAAQLGI
ncbi:prepilin peptidase [Arthrobacter sp. zg-Y1110]|uniref:prepilin peptidase n=1 Tax=Arthrobacter sp. zg-Y1110 TaxID=2886932 RepID=UPI001D13CADF|nr:prepilin peptidase [Arthrobacter sp. zg-Y1110]MCC3292557.1 prepilin peptidase [Arthrobacter sp. zg-Y1110]UWX87011.1 prepilin peptidase [Arthrobacter sp. zg-Y1110]